MDGKTKDTTKGISDITRPTELDEKELSGVSGGAAGRRPAPANNCGGNCMGSVSTAKGSPIEK